MSSSLMSAPIHQHSIHDIEFLLSEEDNDGDDLDVKPHVTCTVHTAQTENKLCLHVFHDHKN